MKIGIGTEVLVVGVSPAVSISAVVCSGSAHCPYQDYRRPRTPNPIPLRVLRSLGFRVEDEGLPGTLFSYSLMGSTY